MASDEERRIILKSPLGFQLVGTWRNPGAQDVVVLCHGFGDYRDGFVLPQLAEALARRGLGSLRIDLPGCGESEGTFRYANMRDEAEDMRAAAEYLREQERNVTGLVGHSKGGSGVVLYAGKYDNIPRVVNVSGRFDNQRGIKERFGEDIFERLEWDGQVEIRTTIPDKGKITWVLTKEDMHNRMTLDMDPPSRAIQKTHVLNIHGSADTTIPVEDARSFHKRIKGSELVIVEGASHNYDEPEHAKELIEQVVHFLIEGKVLQSS